MLKILKTFVETSHEIIVVHDEPDDDSIPIVKALQQDYSSLRIIHNQLGRGIHNALKVGHQCSHGKFELIFAADEIGPILAIDAMLELMESGCDFVSCTRYAHGGKRLGGNLLSGIVSRFANIAFRTFANSQFTDCTTGIKMYKREVFDRLQLEAGAVGWAVAFEMAIKAQLLGLELGEVPIVSIDRPYGGTSTFKFWPWFRTYWSWFWWGVIELRKAPSKLTRTARIQIPNYWVGSLGVKNGNTILSDRGNGLHRKCHNPSIASER